MTKWQQNVSLITSRFFLYDVLRLTGLTYVFMNVILLFTTLLVEGASSYDISFLIVTGIVVGGLAVALLLIALLFFGNKMPYEFAVDEKSASMTLLSKKAKVANKVAFVAGLLAGRPGVAGAGAIAASREKTAIRWKHVYKANYYPGSKIITLKNSWRAVIRLYCTAENYSDVSSYVAERIEESAADREAGRSALAKQRTVMMTGALKIALVLAAALFAWLSPLQKTEWLLLVGMLAGVAMILARPLRVAGSLIAMMAFVAIAGLQISSGFQSRNYYDNLTEHPSFRPAYADYTVFSTLSTEDWLLFSLMILSTGAVILLGVKYLKDALQRSAGEQNQQLQG